MRSAVVVFCVFCVATLLTEALAVAYLWMQGQLTQESWNDIVAVLRGEKVGTEEIEDTQQQQMPSAKDIAQKRVVAILELGARENELNLLEESVNEHADQLIEQQEAFEQEKQQFLAQLEKRLEEVNSESTAQARNILAAMQPADAVQNLMQLDVEKNVDILTGMQDKKVAAILREFGQGDIKQVQRGRDVFEAISDGEPASGLITENIEGLTGQAPANAP